MLGTILLIVLLIMLIGALPSWPHSRNWGYTPTVSISTVLLIIFLLWIFGMI